MVPSLKTLECFKFDWFWLENMLSQSFEMIELSRSFSIHVSIHVFLPVFLPAFLPVFLLPPLDRMFSPMLAKLDPLDSESVLLNLLN